MIKLLRKLLYKSTPIVELSVKPFELYLTDDFGYRWQNLMESFQLPQGLTEDQLIHCLISFGNGSLQDRASELRHLNRHLNSLKLRRLSTHCWTMVIGTSWVQLSSRRLTKLKRYTTSGYAVMAYQNIPLVNGILALHLHLFQRDAMSQLPFFIVQCEQDIPRLGKASPHLASAARRLQRSYGILPRFA